MLPAYCPALHIVPSGVCFFGTIRTADRFLKLWLFQNFNDLGDIKEMVGAGVNQAGGHASSDRVFFIPTCSFFFDRAGG